MSGVFRARNLRHSPGGRVDLEGVNTLEVSDDRMRRIRLAAIAMVAQGAMNSLNPVMRIGAQMVDAIQAHDPKASRREMQERSMEALKSVDLKPEVFRMYSHELSGGMKQRVCIAIGILRRGDRGQI